ncbi:protein kinase C and casein kinase substrate in neurons protein 2-like [Schistocerca americana]|uniref:protein kinase C and casein kinase substrate in neurons protein 2-like n=1 Tax=Schistocerca americana TaxID=7009 RepID=UPI001F4F697B|nr:protein kinase C and casein kinase substrate in neurons protein 2-like [Schistocerca americana]
MQAGEDGGSFWEPGNYSSTTQRIADGRRLCKDLVALVKERADIEKAYAKDLHGWAKKWSDLVDKGPEYGTTEALWKGILIEAEKLGDLHMKIKDKLCNDVVKEVKIWKKESYHKSMMQLKEKKEMEDAFKNAQKPWEKLFYKVDIAKIDYHIAFRTERSVFNQLRNAFADTDLSLSQVRKIQDRSIQSRENLRKAKGKYESALRDLHLYNPKYIEDMTTVFEKCQEMEGERLKFFKKIMFSVHKCLDLSQDPTFLQIYAEFYEAVDNANPERDLQWWSKNRGTHMAMKWPTFEEYQENWREIVKRKSKTEVAPGTTLTNWRALAEDAYESTSRSNRNEMSAQDQTDNNDQNTPIAKGNIKKATCGFMKETIISKNPFEDDESDNDTSITYIDSGEYGIPVRALYDYEATEADELNLKEGDIFEKLEDQDAQGWCKGRKDGRIGLYPANYVELVEHVEQEEHVEHVEQ